MSSDPRPDSASVFLSELGRALDEIDREAVDAVVDVLHGAVTAGRTVFLAGNGGSAATAAHFAVDLSAAAARGPVFRVINLTDNVPRLTALANDRGFEEAFALQLAGQARDGDVLCVFSGSGASENVLRALGTARERGLVTVAFLGFGGGEARALADVAVTLSSRDYAVVESAHNALGHLVARLLGEKLDPETNE